MPRSAVDAISLHMMGMMKFSALYCRTVTRVVSKLRSLGESPYGIADKISTGLAVFVTINFF